MEPSSTTLVLDRLLQRFREGDAAAKEQLIALAFDRLTRISRRLLKSFGGEARVEMWSVEVCNEAYPRIARALDELQPGSVPQFLGLARLQMQRVLLDRIRSLGGRDGNRGPRPQSLFNNDSEAGGEVREPADPRDEEQHRLLMIDLLEGIGALPENEAETVWLKLAGHTHPEIADMLGVHKDTVDRYWGKACIKLAKRLEPFL